MAHATVKWLGSKTFVGIDSTNHSVVLSTKEDGVGVKPSEMLLVALAACTSVDVVDILGKKRLNLTGLEVSTDGEQDPNPPWTYTRIRVHYKLTGKGLTVKDVEQAIQLSEEKYCSVAATVKGKAEIITDFEIIEG
jgi:putative redox protein